MAHLLQPRWTKRNPHTGEKETRHTRRWYGVWRDSQGTRHGVPLSENKQAAAAMLVWAMREKEQELAGLRVPVRRHYTLEGSLAEWQESLRAKGGTARYVRMTAHRSLCGLVCNNEGVALAGRTTAPLGRVSLLKGTVSWQAWTETRRQELAKVGGVHRKRCH
jgi:hypothetical protein